MGISNQISKMKKTSIPDFFTLVYDLEINYDSDFCSAQNESNLRGVQCCVN